MSGWTRIGSGFAWVYGSPRGLRLVAVQPYATGGRTFVWEGEPDRWRDIGGPFTAVLPAFGVYAISYDQQRRVMEWRGTDWRDIGGPAVELIGGADVVSVPGGASWSRIYATVPPSGNIMRWDGEPDRWTEIGGPGAQFVEVEYTGTGRGAVLYGLSPDRAAVFEFSGTPGQWRHVGGAMSSIFGGPNGVLFGFDRDSGQLLRYTGEPMRWVGTAVAAGDRVPLQPGGTLHFGAQQGHPNVYYLSADRQSVWGYRAPSQVGGSAPIVVHPWTQIGGEARMITTFAGAGAGSAAGAEVVGLHPSGSVMLYEWPSVGIAMDAPPAGRVGDEYAFQFRAVGGTAPFTFQAYSGFLPDGCVLDLNGRVHGRPTRAARFGVIVRVFDSTGATADGTFWFDIAAAAAPPSQPPPPPAESRPADVGFVVWDGGFTIVPSLSIIHAGEPFVVQWASTNYGGERAGAHHDRFVVWNLDSGTIVEDSQHSVGALEPGQVDRKDVTVNGLPAGHYRFAVTLNVEGYASEAVPGNNENYIDVEIV